MPSLFLATFCCFCGFGLLLPVSPVWALHGGAGEFGSGVVTAVLMLATVLAQSVVTPVLNRLGWPRTLALGVLLLGLPALLQPLDDGLWLVLLTTAVRGAGFGIVTVCGATAAAVLAPPGRRGAAIGLYGLAIALPQTVFTPAAPWLVSAFALPQVIACGAVPVLALPWVVPLGRAVEARGRALAPGTAAPETAAAGPGTAVLRRVRRPLLVLVLITTCGGAVLTFTPQFAPTPGLAAAALLVFTGTAAAARWALGVLADRAAPRVLSAVLLLVAWIGLLLSSFGVREDAVAAPALVAGVLLLGAAYGGLQSVTLVQALARGGEENRGTTSVVWNIGFDSGTGLGALLLGLCAGLSSFSAGFAVLAVAAATAFATTLLPGGLRTR